MIRAEGVTKIFGPSPKTALPLLEAGKRKSDIQAETGQVVGVNNVSFTLEPGEVFVIMGLSGSGKSTLIRCINRLHEPTAGKIFFQHPDEGEIEITQLAHERLRRLRKSHMSMVFQHFALFPHRSVLDNVAYGLEVQGKPRDERHRHAQEMLEMVGLGDWGQSYPAELSGGMQQRVGLARALATDAEVLLMDEPFSALDPLIKVNMQEELKNIQQQLGRTILFITHDLDEAMRIGDHIAIMEEGEIVQLGTPEEILVNPRTEYVARFVEHADPTGVITAGTIALPFDSQTFTTVSEADGVRFVAAADQPTLHYGLDDQGRLKEARLNEQRLEIRSLDEALESEARGARREDLLMHCPRETVLRRVLRGRTRTALPTLVTDAEGRITGLIDELQLIRGILEKRGPGTDAAPQPTEEEATP
ncbi:betaine/proline/choline family ABC transporter ATP-binding protein [Halomonas mongoliensis]|uniref:Quaternary amine transport ATP-binding protein n=1 Tax=Halomonas mongoliensis TaxID=321265 RepID=A0ABU1GKB4_9GAMM|nr:betaine/proline/choline family ABC transporter ATP-binding protein [Halomonas mongoliensis]MDR5892052.1 betaine/proline/choline family ABC transporter ATP-binding protein [Halomonas mongoliensis]